MRSKVKTLSAGERFSAIVLAVAFFSVIIPAALEVMQHRDAAAQHQLND
ncbi:MAG TPA: hypothetical protein VGP48_12275 [Stellaceae bacterium]|jgi:hypothetical protein|nr:hypothetical protein [Stellaceae bacterium]